MGKKTDLELAREFRAAVSAIIPVERFIFFGSRATGRRGRWSDFDFIIVSRKFRGIKWHLRSSQTKIYAAWEPVEPADMLCYTPEEFRRLAGRVGIVRQALREGIAL